MLAAPAETQGEIIPLLDQLDEAVKYAYEPGSPGMLAYVPGGGLSVSAVADFYARITNRFASMARVAPALVALEPKIALYEGAVIPPEVWGFDWVAEASRAAQGLTPQTYVEHIEVVSQMLATPNSLPQA